MSSNKSNGLETTDWARAPPVSGPLWERLVKAIYNPEDKSFLGRTPKRWGIVLTFYLVFYAVLVLMFALCMGGLFLSLEKGRPKYTLESSLIGANPGVAYRPLPEDGLFVIYDRTNSTHYETYTEKLEKFLKPYKSEGQPGCSAIDSYGYPDTPCFYIKLNKIYGWVPEYYSDTSSLPADMPEDLVEYIGKDENLEKEPKIWVSCFQEKGNDTSIEYPWGRGLPSTSYPFLSQEGYVSPVVAVKLTPQANTLTIIRCRTWAKNIIYNKSIKEPSGYTRIQLYINDQTMPEEAAETN
ncbi:sodium/potassium-transporting ATPase subunit beta-1-like [Pectinophora gossypiella]|uniref:sodium/potassium-transporting ATPase subunit beta-1-like n=1 Tax=Pectinophora gossypiella TaxID=13191 RepID=UPI00214E5C17|nr:sodium/potassium-transporting ATPase subunit beta-1-like [Pectinophora gossypiella]